MMLNLQLAELSAVGSEYTQNLPLGGIVGSLFLFELVSILPFSFKDAGSFDLTNTLTVFSNLPVGTLNWFNSLFITNPEIYSDVHQMFNVAGKTDANFTNFLQIQSIGQSLYTYGSMWLLVTSIILLLAMVGPISLSINRVNQLLQSPFYY